MELNFSMFSYDNNNSFKNIISTMLIKETPKGVHCMILIDTDLVCLKGLDHSCRPSSCSFATGNVCGPLFVSIATILL